MLMIKRLMTQYTPGMLTCEEVDGFLYDFHEGNLSYVEKLKFKLHLSMCRECKDYVSKYKDTIRISQTGFIKTNQIENVPEDLMQAILKSRTTK
jgi:predicted anti-sigma-YlaC factor YlaD